MTSVAVLESNIELILFLHSGDETETDSEVEDRVDGVKSWLSKNKSSTKTLSDEGSLKSTRSVPTSLCITTDNHVHPHGDAVMNVARPLKNEKRPRITLGSLQQTDGYIM